MEQQGCNYLSALLLLPSSFTSAFTDKLRLMKEISKEPACLPITYGQVECERTSPEQQGTPNQLVFSPIPVPIELFLSLVHFSYYTYQSQNTFIRPTE